jgi:hypothetical protein
LIGEIENLSEQFEDVDLEFNDYARGDFDGDGRTDRLRLAGENLEFFLGEADPALPENLAWINDLEGGGALGRMLFAESRREITLDTLVSFIKDAISAIEEMSVQEREPGFRMPIDKEIADRVRRMESRDLNGDGRDDVIAFLAARGDRQTIHIWMSETDPQYK